MSETLMRISATILRVRDEDRSDPLFQHELDAYCERAIHLISQELNNLENRSVVENLRLDLEVAPGYVLFLPKTSPISFSVIGQQTTANDPTYIKSW